MRRRKPGVVAAVVASLSLLTTGSMGCGQSSATEDPPNLPKHSPAAIESLPAPLGMDEIQCEDLLSEAEVEQVLNLDVTPIGRKASSCYWSGDTGFVQLVFNTGAGFAAWKRELLHSFTEEIETAGFEVWAEPATGSVTAFGRDRGLIIHGVHSKKDAVTLISLAFGRLTR